MQCGVGYAVRGTKNRKEKDLITYVYVDLLFNTNAIVIVDYVRSILT